MKIIKGIVSTVKFLLDILFCVSTVSLLYKYVKDYDRNNEEESVKVTLFDTKQKASKETCKLNVIGF